MLDLQETSIRPRPFGDSLRPSDWPRAKYNPPIGYHVYIPYFDWPPGALSANPNVPCLWSDHIYDVCAIFSDFDNPRNSQKTERQKTGLNDPVEDGDDDEGGADDDSTDDDEKTDDDENYESGGGYESAGGSSYGRGEGGYESGGGGSYASGGGSYSDGGGGGYDASSAGGDGD